MTTDWTTATALLRCSAQLVEGVQVGLRERGFTDVRPAHGFAFVFLSAGPASVSELAEYLAVTKQAAAQLVDHLVTCGYVTRHQDPADGRAWSLHLTARGRRCTEAAEAAAADVIASWRVDVPPAEFRHFRATLERVARPGRLRPSW